MGKFKCKSCEQERFNLLVSPNMITIVCVKCGHQDFIETNSTIEEVE